MDAIGLSANRSIIRLSVLHLPIHDLGGERPIPATMALLEPFISRKGHPENMGDAREHTFEELCQIVGAIAAAYGMRCVYLFGSRARSDNTADSDYDFFVVPDDDCGMFRLAGFFGKLQEALGDVDVVCYDPAEGEDFTERISEDLRLVYEA